MPALAIIGFILALPGLLLIALASHIDEERTVNRMIRRYS